MMAGQIFLLCRLQTPATGFTQHAYQINRNLSSFGDKVEDFLLANFVDGDRTNGGYDYSQLQQLGLRFNVLQLSRFIPLALDTMQLTVDSLVFLY